MRSKGTMIRAAHLRRGRTRRLCHAAAAVLCLMAGVDRASAAGSPFSDAHIQSPEIAAPSRGSLVGQYAATQFGPGDVGRGSFSLPLPVSVPQERGPLLANVFPTYSPDAGLSEWGIGWSSSGLTMTRSRITGDIDYTTDDRTGPWGRMVRGDDGAWYPVGLDKAVRVVEEGDTLTAYLPDGSRWTFGGDARVVTPAGTYSWHLRRIVPVTGAPTELTYLRNASGRLYLEHLHYGGIGAPSYEIAFQYDIVPHPVSDYRSRVRLMQDRRVRQVTLSQRTGTDGAFHARWRYAFGYLGGDDTPVFYLSDVTQTFASGESAPTVRYTYNAARQHFGDLQAHRAWKLDSVFPRFPSDILTPRRAAMIDIDNDGRPDFELHEDNSVLRQTDEGYVQERLPIRAGAERLCREPDSSGLPPRLLTKLKSSDEAYSAIAFRKLNHGNTGMIACTRDGEVIHTQTLPGDWEVGDDIKLVDLNRDHQPDFVRIYPGMVEILPNVSTDQGYGFGAMRRGRLSPETHMDSLWVQDMNGDGIPDLVARTGVPSHKWLLVWYGKGNFEFEEEAVTPEFRVEGGEFSELAQQQIIFFDSNNDGLTDILMNDGSYQRLFINQGGKFVNTRVKAFDDWAGEQAMVADVEGHGNTEVFFVGLRNAAYAVELTSPGLGLLHTADDGKGTVIEFGYKRAAPEVGVRYRNSLLDRVTVTSTGYDPVTYEYDYAKPTLHTRGKFLLGYTEVTRRAPLASDAMTFLHEDHHAGLMLADITLDYLHWGAKRVTYRQYEDAEFRGIPWKRLAAEGKGWESTNPLSPAIALEQSDYLEYEDGVCPRKVRQSNAHGTMMTSTTYTHVPEFDAHLMCMDAQIVMTSADAYPFTHEAAFARNARGQLTTVTLMGPDGPLVEQEIDYTPNGQVKSLGSPGKGLSVFQYTPETGLLQSVLSPDQVLTEVTKRDPVTDGILSMRTVRGPSLVHTQHYRFDGQERLVMSWDDLGHASESMPNEALAYRYAQGNMPGRILVRKLIDAAAHHYAESAELMTAAGDSLAMMTRIPEGWRVSELTSRSRITGTTSMWVHPGVLSSTDSTVEGLFAGAHSTGSVKASSFEIPSFETTSFHEGVTQAFQRMVSVSADRVEHTTTENDVYVTRASVDPSGRPMRKVDAAGAPIGFKYDALGRLREVNLADSATHKTAYDQYGRPSRIDRDAVGAIEHRYAPVTGHLVGKHYFPATAEAEAARRSVAYAHDGHGRVTEEVHTDHATGKQQTFRFYYDGATPSEPHRRDALGLLTAVEGEGYTKAWTYRPDGSVKTYVFALEGWRTFTSIFEYADDGELRARTLVVTDAHGSPIHTVHEALLRDAWGRPAGSHRNGAPFLSYAYDVRGLPDFAAFAGPLTAGEHVTFHHDAHTLARTGVNQHSANWSASVSHRMNARGFIGHENVTAPESEFERKYGYSPEGYLADATDPMGRSEYEYDRVGLPSKTTTDILGSDEVRLMLRVGDVLSTSAHQHRFDALGRAVARDDVDIEYGPNGQVKRASKGGKTWEYLYDEKGLRIAKRIGDALVTAYLEGGTYLDATSLIEPVHAMGVLVGVMKHTASGGAKFHMLATDSRGSVLTDQDGAPHIPSAFGDRKTRPELSAALDYAAQGYDPDLGTIRMGVRDYDPVLARFLTPDPLFLESMEKCIESPTSCNLYAYARNNPLLYVDPTGTDESINLPTSEIRAWGMGIQNFQVDHKQALDNIEKGSYAALAVGAAIITYGAVTVIAESAAVTEAGIQAWGLWQRTGGPVVSWLRAGVAAVFNNGKTENVASPAANDVTGAVNPNKLYHIFAKAAHSLDPVVKHFGSEERAFNAIESAIIDEMKGIDIKGMYMRTVQVEDFSITVSGIILDGVARVGTAYIEKK